MIELPEAVVLAGQINETLTGKRIRNVTAALSPHKFAWYCGEPQGYADLLAGKVIGTAINQGGMVEVKAGDAILLFTDGVNLRYLAKNEKPPRKHQLLLVFEDGTSLVGSVQMYGGLWAFPAGTFDNEYYAIAKAKPSPVTGVFDKTYFNGLFGEDTAKLSLKAFLATEQRIPGLGNGVLQDILFNAKMHPKRKVSTLTGSDKEVLFNSIKSTLNRMIADGGRDTEKDLYGEPCGYRTLLSKNTVGKPCPVCGGIIKKEAYMGGSIYYCDGCQKS